MFFFRLSGWRYKFLWILSLLLVLSSTTEATIVKYADPLEIYPNNITFNVFRDGVSVGKHQVTFTKLEEGGFRVVAQLELQVTFLSFPVYKLHYKSNAVWQNGELKNLNSTTNDDGKIFTINVIRKRNELTVVSKNTKFQTNKNTLPTNHWNPEVLGDNKVINTLTGELSSIRITSRGKEKIDSMDKTILATKYEYSGDISTLVWYSDHGNWVKMKFKASDGSDIEYKCIECGI